MNSVAWSTADLDDARRLTTAMDPKSSPLGVWVLSALLVVTVIGQRLAFPVNGFRLPLSLVATYCACALLVATRVLRPDRLRSELFVLATSACFLAAYLSSWTLNPVSSTSVLYLLAIYAPWVLTVRARDRAVFVRVADTFVRTMVVLALVGIGQVGAQILGVWSYRDYVLTWFSATATIDTYNVSIPVSFGSSIYKANAFVFLEPSFMSQFCALAILVGLARRAPSWQVVVLGGGLVATLSGTGILLLGFGVAVIALRSPIQIRPQFVVISLLAAVALLLSPAGALLLTRSGEFGQEGSSGSLRFVQPYQEVAVGLDADRSRYAVGAGPGTSERLLTSSRFSGAAVVYPIPAKLIFEYGVPAGGLFLLFLVVSLLQGTPARTVPLALLFMVFLLSGALLQPHTQVIAWLLSSVWAGRPLGDRARRGRQSGPAASPTPRAR